MAIDRRALAAALAALLLVAACGGSASTAPGASSSASATPAAASEEPTATAEATETPEATDAVVPPSLVPGAAGDLEAMLPSEANGVKFEKASFDGATVPGGLPIGQGDDFTKFLADNGKKLSDVKIAVATPTDTTTGSSLVMAIQVAGIPSDKLLTWVTKETSDLAKSTVGGKEVYGSDAGGFGAYFYVKDDTVFYVLSMGGDAKTTEDILRQLP